MKVVVNNLMINYTRQGEGRKLLVLHGWGDNINGIKQLITGLAMHSEVIALDLPGFGDSEGPKEAWGLDNYAGLVRDFLNKIGCSDIYCAIGHSNGGAVLIKACSTKVISPNKLILIAASGVRDRNNTRRLVLKLIAKVGNLATIWLPTSTRARLRKSLYGVAGSDEQVVPELKETFRRTVREDVQADASRINQPTLLIYAEDDKAVPLQIGRTFSKLIPNSKLAILPNAGHFIHLDQPDKTQDLIQGFLDA